MNNYNSLFTSYSFKKRRIVYELFRATSNCLKLKIQLEFLVHRPFISETSIIRQRDTLNNKFTENIAVKVQQTCVSLISGNKYGQWNVFQVHLAFNITFRNIFLLFVNAYNNTVQWTVHCAIVHTHRVGWTLIA